MYLFKNGSRNSEKGMALLLAIGFLAILSILGAVVMQVVTRDLGETASYSPAKQAFYVSDRAVEYAMNRDIVISLSPSVSVDLMLDDDITPGGLTHKEIIEAGAAGTLLAGTVQDLGPTSPLPPAVAELYGTDFGTNVYHTQVESTAPGVGSAGKSHVNAGYVRIYKIDDDTIFHTSGGG
ncbi:MAG: hypothetical protein ACSLFH_02230 [Desulfuromonadales bacterium]